MKNILIASAVLIPAALITFYLIKARRATRQVWASFAKRRGLTSHDLWGAGKSRGPKTSMKTKQPNKALQALSAFSMPRITGKNNGFPFELSTLKKGSGNNKVLYSFMKLELESLPTGIHVYPEKSVHKVIKIFGYQDIQTGDPEFDGKFMVRGENPEQVLSYLTWNRQTALKKYSIKIPNLELRKGAIYMERRGLIKKIDELEKLFRELGKLATALT
ncbi:hypothetical protein MNBD_NITROSPINAE03-468 [hydrothermal vent metagenome]|uniref:Uncharacterized protein n=1 Tax=hydrothermal vent metagenome TaxID=652676 RepID=A0A3B1C2D7_9ZZZZ